MQGSVRACTGVPVCSGLAMANTALYVGECVSTAEVWKKASCGEDWLRGAPPSPPVSTLCTGVVVGVQLSRVFQTGADRK